MALKLALNHIKLPASIAVPLKFDEFEPRAEQAGGGGGGGVEGQIKGLVEKAMGTVLPDEARVALPLSE